MDIETYYLSSVSVAATLFSLVLIIWGAVTIWLVMRIKKVMDKLDKVTEAGSDMAHNVSDLVRTTTQRLVTLETAFLTAQGLKQVASLVANLFHHKKNTADKNTADADKS